MPFCADDVIAERYRLHSRLGISGARETWLVDDVQQNHHPWVLKLLYFGGDTGWQDLKLLEREAQTLQSLHHPGIPHYGDAFWSERPEGHYFCLLQEYIPGRTLAEQMRQGGRYNSRQLEDLAIAVLEILQYLHSQTPPVVHRDLKPSNILQGEDGAFYLIDFGAVQAQVSGRGTMTVVGTFGYMPPEQFAGQAVPASDLYALGMTLIYLTSGVDPVELPRVGLRIDFGGRVYLETGWQLWLARMVEPDVARRWGSAAEAIQGLSSRHKLAEAQERVIANTAGETKPSLSFWQTIVLGVIQLSLAFLSLPVSLVLFSALFGFPYSKGPFLIFWFVTLLMFLGPLAVLQLGGARAVQRKIRAFLDGQ